MPEKKNRTVTTRKKGKQGNDTELEYIENVTDPSLTMVALKIHRNEFLRTSMISRCHMARYSSYPFSPYRSDTNACGLLSSFGKGVARVEAVSRPISNSAKAATKSWTET